MVIPAEPMPAGTPASPRPGALHAKSSLQLLTKISKITEVLEGLAVGWHLAGSRNRSPALQPAHAEEIAGGQLGNPLRCEMSHQRSFEGAGSDGSDMLHRVGTDPAEMP